VPEEKFACEKYTGCALAANCAKSACAASVCQKCARNSVPEKNFAYKKYTSSNYSAKQHAANAI
jgi:hypothetical protein